MRTRPIVSILITILSFALSACVLGNSDSGSEGSMTARINGEAWKATRGVLWSSAIGEGVFVLGKAGKSGDIEELSFGFDESGTGTHPMTFGEYYSDEEGSHALVSGSVTITRSGGGVLEGTFTAQMLGSSGTLQITGGKFKALYKAPEEE